MLAEVEAEPFLARVRTERQERTDGLEEAEPAAAFRIFPNPGTGVFTIQPSAVAGQIASIEVFDLTGRLVFFQKGGPAGPIEIDISNLPSSLYYLEVQGELGFWTGRLVKNRAIF